jgi:hypothetical protein
MLLIVAGLLALSRDFDRDILQTELRHDDLVFMAGMLAPENIALVMVASHVDDLAVADIHEEILVESRHGGLVSIAIRLHNLTHHALDIGVVHRPEICGGNICHIVLEFLDVVIKFRNLHY